MGIRNIPTDPNAPPRTARTLRILGRTSRFVKTPIHMARGKFDIEPDPAGGLEVDDDGIKLVDGTLALSDLENIATDTLLGRDTTGTGVPELLTVGGGLTFTGSGGIGIANNGVTDAKLRDSAACSVIGNSSNGALSPVDLGAPANGQYIRRHNNALGFGGILSQDMPAATTTTQGALKKAAARADCAAIQAVETADSSYSFGGPATEDVLLDHIKADIIEIHTVLNDLLAKLRSAGRLAT